MPPAPIPGNEQARLEALRRYQVLDTGPDETFDRFTRLASAMLGTPIALLSFVVGVGYAIWTIATQSHVTNSSVLLIVLAVMVFLVGLVSEQISALRFEGRR